jgi:hypothetical protein
VPPTSDDSWTAYARLVVEIAWPAGGTLRVRPAPTPDSDRWPWPDGSPVHILTAWNPGRQRPGPEQNRVRQAALEAELAVPGVDGSGLELLTAVGVDPVTGDLDEGVAVRGARESAMAALGARYGQDAIFAWAPEEWAIVACRSGHREVGGWSVELPGPGFRFSRSPDMPI